MHDLLIYDQSCSLIFCHLALTTWNYRSAIASADYFDRYCRLSDLHAIVLTIIYSPNNQLCHFIVLSRHDHWAVTTVQTLLVGILAILISRLVVKYAPVHLSWTSYTSLPRGQQSPAHIWPAKSDNPGHGGSSGGTLNAAYMFPPNAPKDAQLFSRQVGFSRALLVYADWLSYAHWCVDTVLLA